MTRLEVIKKRIGPDSTVANYIVSEQAKEDIALLLEAVEATKGLVELKNKPSFNQAVFFNHLERALGRLLKEDTNN